MKTYKPYKSYVTNSQYGYTGTLVGYLGLDRWVVKTLPNGVTVEAGIYTIDPVINHVPEFWCNTCQDYGVIDIFHPSTDAYMTSIPCDCKPTIWLQLNPWWMNETKFIPSDSTPPF